MTCGRKIGEFDCCSVVEGDATLLLSSPPKPFFVLTDPPYGISHPTNYHKRGRGKLAKCSDYPEVVGDNKPFDPAWLLSFNVPTVMWGANHFASRLPDSGGWIVWDKKRPPTLDQATCELAWTNFVKGVRIFHFLWNGMMREGSPKEKLFHPTQKPIQLTEWILNLKWTPRESLMLDPYCGAGSSLIAAKKLGRHFLGIDICPEYCEIARQRLSEIPWHPAIKVEP